MSSQKATRRELANALLRNNIFSIRLVKLLRSEMSCDTGFFKVTNRVWTKSKKESLKLLLEMQFPGEGNADEVPVSEAAPRKVIIFRRLFQMGSGRIYPVHNGWINVFQLGMNILILWMGEMFQDNG